MHRLESPKVENRTELKHQDSGSKRNQSHYLKAKDDGPDETQGETVITVHDVVRAHVFKMNLLLLEKLQGFINILQAVDTHAAFGRPWL